MPSPSLILHHYDMSPYAQKIRAMLGYADLEWQSVITREGPPRPQLEPLAGAYRRIPVAQIGADVFCDSKLIAREIAALANLPELAPENAGEVAQDWIDRAQGQLFFAAVVSAVSVKFLINAIRALSFSGLKELMADRAEMGKTSTIKAPPRKEARAMMNTHLANIEKQLDSDFLLGEKPQLADFAVYHGLWMIHVQGGKRFIRRYPKTVAWIARIQAFGIGRATPLAAEHALEIAKDHQPRAIAESEQQHALIGKPVAIGPNDYAQQATSGVLVGSTPQSWIIAREHPQTGLVHVHFPKAGYDLIAQ